MREAGDLALVLHTHMPYVEGFGTYPFGEEWLFDAAARSYLPLLDVVERLTMTVTPVLADQLEAPGVAGRMRDFLVEHRAGAARLDAEEVPAELRPAALAEAEAYERAVACLDACGGDLVGKLADLQSERRVALMASAATHAVLPMLATTAGQRLQIDAGLRSHQRRFGSPHGFWLPECAYRPGTERLLAERGVHWFCVDQSRFNGPDGVPAPLRPPGGPTAFSIDWATVQRVWSPSGYPSDPAYAEYHRLSERGMRVWAIGGGPYDPEAGARRAREHAVEFVETVHERLQAARGGGRALCVFAIDTELLGHWWSEGPLWLAEVLRIADARGVRLVTLSEALAEVEAVEATPRESTWGEGKDLSTWDATEVADLAWAARRLELRLVRDVGREALAPAAAARAARELLALQASDWAFLDKQGQAGDYPFRRVVSHAQAMLEALDSVEPPAPSIRNLAPDLSLAPLLEP